jgi:menaquinol-cytochrome c reductase iron-sulfur subunit
MNQQELPSRPADSIVEPASEAMSAKGAGHSRRVFLFKLSLLLNAAVGTVLAIPIFGYLMGPTLKKDAANNSWVDLGEIGGFPNGETRLVNFRNPVTTEWDGQTGDVPCWVRRISEQKFQVFAINCAHLGCPVRWFAQSKLFMCPCHGGAYYADGTRASGPPERGLFEYELKIVNGRLMIDAGNMPTVATQAKLEGSLMQITGASLPAIATMEKPKPRCGSCPS